MAKKPGEKKPASLGRPKVVGEELLDLVFKEDFYARQIFVFLGVRTVRELEEFPPEQIFERAAQPIRETIEPNPQAIGAAQPVAQVRSGIRLKIPGDSRRRTAKLGILAGNSRNSRNSPLNILSAVATAGAGRLQTGPHSPSVCRRSLNSLSRFNVERPVPSVDFGPGTKHRPGSAGQTGTDPAGDRRTARRRGMC